jgi:hypothetical protein
MKAEQLQLALRPRPVHEAVDLGVRMAQRNAPSLARAYLPFALLLAVACGTTVELAPWLPSLLLWWLKPWLDRTLLHVYARQAFGEPTGFAEAWEARRRAPWLPMLQLLTLWRLSFWRAYAMPVAQLEGQSGAARRQRIRTILRSHRGAALMMQKAFLSCELAMAVALLALVPWMTPGLRTLDGLGLFASENAWAALAAYGAYALAMTFVEPFYVAAGFAMYLNRRVELEAWDVEQDLRHAFDQR